MKFLGSVLYFVFSWVFVSAQIPVGSWRMHLPAHLGLHLAYSPEKVYCLAGQSLFSYKLSDNSVESLSKINGLSDFGANAIAYSADFKSLIVGYDNGNIDLVKGKVVTNISDLKSKLLPASKAINHISVNGKWAYLSCGFGIVLLDLEKQEVKDTYVFGANGSYVQVNSSAILGDYIYAATSAGIYKANVTDALLVDYSRWNRVSNIPNFDRSFLQVTANENILYAIYTDPSVGGDVLYYFMDNVWSSVNLDENTDIYHVGFSGNRIYVSTSINIKVFDSGFNLKQTVWQYADIGPSQPRETFIDSNENLWVADYGNGLVEIRANGNVYQMKPNGPTSGNVRVFCFSNNSLFATMGGIDVSYQNLYNVGGFSVFSNDEWKSYNYEETFDFMYAKPSPADHELIYITSWGNGVFAFKNGEQLSHYDETNSTLQNAAAGGPNTRVWGLDFDKDNNLWVSNSLVSNSLSVMKSDGSWVGYPLKSTIGNELVGDVVVDDFNNIWLVLLNGGGILVLNTNNTPDNRDDDKFVKFKPKNAYGTIISNIYTLAKDMDGALWLGTDYGPVVYSDPDEVFEGNTDGTQPTIPRHDGTNQEDPLLGSEVVRTIVIDGANRKWIGTDRGGAFLVSADGDSSLLQFNTDNSPILSNTVVGIGIHDKTGEVFFGTDRGIISYRSDATKAGDDFGDVYAFPNPVRPNYHGNITITGLIKDANVKITDVAGNLVYETTTLGGQIVWDGNNLDGRRVASGVYIIFCTNDDGSKTHITKLLFMN